METEEHKILTFKEVHAELEMENSLLLKEHNIADFSSKSDFLTSIGFTNSKATKMYKAIVDSEAYRKDFNHRYKGMYKFILKEQLERVCEKYNLYVRPLDMFAGDIPEKNIKDMMDFKFYLKDLIHIPNFIIQHFLLKNRHNIDGFYVPMDKTDYQVAEELAKTHSSEYIPNIFHLCGFNPDDKYPLSQINDITSRFRTKLVNKLFDGNSSSLSTYLSGSRRRNLPNIFGRLEIAAVESLFIPQAFENDNSRLGDSPRELIATGQVDLDPIVMLKNDVGYIIITAWGDEANDELIVNQQMN